MSSPELKTYVVLNRSLEAVGVVSAETIGEAILKIPPNHGIDQQTATTETGLEVQEILNVQDNKEGEQ